MASHEDLLDQLTDAIERNREQADQERIFNLIKEKKLPFEAKSMSYNPLHKACWNKNVRMTKLLLSHGADPDILNTNKKCPLHYAAEFNAVQCAQLVLDKDAQVDVVEGRGRTPLYIAAEYEGNDVGILLLAYGADPYLKCFHAGGPLFL